MDTKELLKKVRKIEIKTRKLSDNIFGGEYHSTFKGRGMTFSEVRPYQFGDDIRMIDWNVTARYNEPFVKVFEEERELTLMLMVDVSGSELFGTQQQFKSEIITEIAATLAFSALQNNDKTGLILFSDQIELFIPPKKGKSHVLRIIRELIEFEPKSFKTNIGEALQFLSRVMKKKAIVFMLSDFIDKGYEKPIQIAAKKHDITGIRIYDQKETELPNLGYIMVKDAETGHEMFIDTASAKLRRAHTEYWLERMNTLKTTFAQSNVDWVSVATNEDYVKAMMLLFMQRGQNR